MRATGFAASSTIGNIIQNTKYSWPQLEGFYKTHSDPKTISQFFLRGTPPALLSVCLKFPNTDAPVLVHLPEHTANRLIETLPRNLVGTTFVENGRSCFGLSSDTLKSQLPRWKCATDYERARRLAARLSAQVIVNKSFLCDGLLPDIIHITGQLTAAKLISVEVSNEILKEILPVCLERKSLSRHDLLSIVSGIGKVPPSKENAILFPMISNFAVWYLERNAMNRQRRKLEKLHQIQLVKRLDSS
jgi:hypothetical protein